jgi:signal transduction histidine kinase
VRDFGRLGERIAVPVLLAVAVFALSFLAPGRPIGLLDQDPLDTQFGDYMLWVAGFLATGCAVGALIARRSRWLLYLFALPAFLTFGSWPGLLTASYYAAVNRRRLPLVFFAVIVAASYVIAAVYVYPFRIEFAIWAVLSAALVVGLPTAVGLWVRERRRVFAGLVEKAEQAGREQRVRAERARAQERGRIAREMHDVVAHRVSLMVLHAGALEMNAPDDATAEAAALIRTTGRDALEDLRAALGVLRDGDTGPAPLPTLADVDDLLEQSRAAGVTISRHDEGDPGAFPSALERTLYRVVQEALTNVHKHAPAASTRVDFCWRQDLVGVEIRNDPPPRRELPADTMPGSGSGLDGLRERVELLGGTFAAGRRLDGGFSVSAHLPVEELA